MVLGEAWGYERALRGSRACGGTEVIGRNRGIWGNGALGLRWWLGLSECGLFWFATNGFWRASGAWVRCVTHRESIGLLRVD